MSQLNLAWQRIRAAYLANLESQVFLVLSMLPVVLLLGFVTARPFIWHSAAITLLYLVGGVCILTGLRWLAALLLSRWSS